EGGVISFDAASSEEGDNRNELADAAAETHRRSSEDVEHYMKTAKLSEREANAIRYRLDKNPQMPGAEFSSSTSRRAVTKLKQVVSDEKFRDSPRGPKPSECAYGQLPKAERSAAVLYDQLRRTPWFVNAIDSWRKSVESNDARVFLQKQAALKRFPLRILDQHWSEQLRNYREAASKRDDALCRQFIAAVDITVAFQEWPAVGYCQLDRAIRRKRLEEFGWTFGA